MFLFFKVIIPCVFLVLDLFHVCKPFIRHITTKNLLMSQGFGSSNVFSMYRYQVLSRDSFCIRNCDQRQRN